MNVEEWRNSDGKPMEYGIMAMDNPRLIRGAKAVMSERLWAARLGRTSKA